jgi:hypothetical protein
LNTTGQSIGKSDDGFTLNAMLTSSETPYAMRLFSHYSLLIRYFFIALLLASAIGKLLNMQGFYGVMRSYQVIPSIFVMPSAWLLVAIESGLCIWLMSGARLREAASVLIALHMIYFSWLLLALLRGLDIPNCGCFGVYFARPLTWFTLIEDAILIALAILLWRGALTPTIKGIP